MMQLIKEYINKVYLIGAEEVYKELTEIYKKDKEFFIVFCLDSKNKVISREIVHIGTLNQCVVHPREIFKGAILRGANCIIIAHNHPSGDLEPSKEDIKITNKLKECGDLLQIDLLDHVIVSQEGYKSIMGAKE